MRLKLVVKGGGDTHGNLIITFADTSPGLVRELIQWYTDLLTILHLAKLVSSDRREECEGVEKRLT